VVAAALLEFGCSPDRKTNENSNLSASWRTGLHASPDTRMAPDDEFEAVVRTPAIYTVAIMVQLFTSTISGQTIVSPEKKPLHWFGRSGRELSPLRESPSIHVHVWLRLHPRRDRA
jgi:hypothetical protein